MDYEYSVIGSISGNADTLSSIADTEFTYNKYIFVIRKIGNSVGISLHDTHSTGESDCKTIPDEDIIAVCKLLSEKYACTVSIRKGYEVYGNANVFNGGSDYEVIEEKWLSVEFDNGIARKLH